MTDSTLAAALKPFGWTCGPDFDKRYATDPWVFNLANAVERLTAENERLRQAGDKLADQLEDQPRWVPDVYLEDDAAALAAWRAVNPEAREIAGP